MTNDRIAALRKAVDTNPDDVLLRLVLAESLVTAGDSEEQQLEERPAHERLRERMDQRVH